MTLVQVVKFNDENGIMPQTFIRDCNLVFATKAESGQLQSDRQKVLFAVNNTLGKAHDWAATWHDSVEVTDATWINFCAAFLEQFVPIDDEVNALNKLRQLKISSEFQSLEAGLKQYTSVFNETLLRLPNEPEIVVSKIYLSNLFFPLQKEVQQSIQQWRSEQVLAVGELRQQLFPALVQIRAWSHAACTRVQPNWKSSSGRNNEQFSNQRNRAAKRNYHQVSSSELTAGNSNNAGGAQRTDVNATQAAYQSNAPRQPPRQNMLSEPERMYCMQQRLCFNCKQSLSDNHKPRIGRCPRATQPMPASATYKRSN